MDDPCRAEGEKAFKSSLWNLYLKFLIAHLNDLIRNEVDKTYNKAIENGITNYIDWTKWVVENDNIRKTN